MFIASGILLSVIVFAGFMGCASQFGARSKGESLRKVQSSEHYRNGKFINLEETAVMRKESSYIGGIFKWIKGSEDAVPRYPLPSERFDRDSFLKNSNGIGVVWFGHSTVLLNIEGNIVLTDPVFSKNPSPVHVGNKAFDFVMTTEAEDLPDIDAVILSHDHYDHLDMETIQKLRDKTKLFLVPLGVAAHLIRWGIPEDRIVELDWWQNHTLNGKIRFTAAPARHFSGRGLTDRDETLWCSWVVQTGGRRVFFSGDSGYGKHFKQIGEKFGPFDLAMMECGQYGNDWPLIHMKPEETLAAFDDLKGKVLLPVHWGKFKLSLHSWTDPVERIRAGMDTRKVMTPVVGAVVSADSPVASPWWQAVKRKNDYRSASLSNAHEG